jgi:microcystin-dependent protein
MRRFLAGVMIALGIFIPLAYAADTTTTNLLMTNQEAGGNLNTWGDIADANFERLDDKLGDTTSISTTGGNTSLTSSQELVQIISVTGTLVSNATLTFSCRGGYWVISNGTSGAYTLTAKCSGQTGAAITQGAKVGVYSDGTDIRAVGASGTKAVGEVFDYAGTSCPSQSVEPYGQAISRTTYAALFAITSTTYGVGDGATTFNVPDLRGRVVAGEDDMGSSSANRLIDAGSQSLNGDTLGDTGGEEVHTMTTGEMVAHLHAAGTYAVGSHSHTGGTFVAANHAHDAGSYSVNTSITNGTSVMRSAGTDNIQDTGSGTTVVSSFTSSTLSLASGSVSGTAGGSGSLAVTGTSDLATPSFSGSSASTGSTTAFNQVQPTIILHKCIYTGV